MAKWIRPTKEEIEQIKQHFRDRGFGEIPDDTAKIQVEVLKMIREKNNGKN